MRIVLDTNVHVSGLLSPFGPPAQIVRLVASGTIVLCHDARILAEWKTSPETKRGLPVSSGKRDYLHR
jgi:predicted nucleic acid-binding protein